MLRSLRKGRISVYVQHAFTGHNIGAEKFEAEVRDGKAILRLTLRPVDGNQRDDETYLHEHPLTSIAIDDTGVIHGLEAHAKQRRAEFSSWELQILSRGQLLCFPVVPQYQQQGLREVLTLAVARAGDA